MEELTELRQRLEEAEEVCRALRAGEVDAVVVGHEQEAKRVLLMSGAYARYRQVVEDMEQGAVTVTPAGEILFANRAFARMVGGEVGLLLRSPLSELVQASDGDKLAELLTSSGRAGEVLVTLVDSQNKKTHARVTSVGATEDFITLLVSSLEDRHLYDEARSTIEAIERGTVDAFVIGGDRVVTLESMQAPYRQLVEQMHDGAVILESDGCITYANERLVGMLKTPHPLVIGERLQKFLVAADRAVLDRLLSATHGGHGELHLSLPRGDTLSTHATVSRADGKHLVLFSDVSQRKRHAASEERTRKFLGLLAQEFGNMLGPIRQSTTQLLTTSPDEASKKAVETIVRQTDRMAALIEELRRLNPDD
jgi:PAS domain-containing protein